MNSPEYFDADAPDVEPIQGYCLRCRESIEMESPRAIFTRRGQPATQGDCPICGGMVFRMGKTALHENKERPSAVIVAEEQEKRQRPQLTRDMIYVHYAAADEEAAQQIAADLGKSGLAVWLHDSDVDDNQWARGIHPALKECTRMVFVVSTAAARDETLSAGWQFFKDKRKPIVIAQVGGEVPDALRRAPRFDFGADYKSALRQMVNALSV
jgi:hypothetical protein